VTRLWWSLIFAVLMALFCTDGQAQITATSYEVTAQVASLVCVLTATGAVCTGNGQPYTVVTPPFSPGADASGQIVWNGNTLSYWFWARGTVISWMVSIKPNVGVGFQQSGVFGLPAGPKIAGTLADAVCTAFTPLFQLSADGHGMNSGPTGNCWLP
jgi:hypothetical protein